MAIINGIIYAFGSTSGLTLQVDYSHQRSGNSMQYKFSVKLFISDRSGNLNPYGQYDNNLRVGIKLDDVEHWSVNNGGHSNKGWSDSWETGWCTVENKISGDTGFVITVNDTINSGWCQYTSERVSLAVDPVAPSNVSINPVASRTSINLNRNWSNATSCQYNINSLGWIDEGTSYSNGIHCDGDNVTNLNPNTTYTCQIRFYNNGAGPTYSGTSSVTTTGNAPTLNSVSPEPSRLSCSLANYSVSYDTNASYSSVSIKYGTTTSYGNTSSSTTLTSLTPNTKYYYSMTITDNWSRTSSAKTGNFTTTGNAPSISSASITPDKEHATLNYSVAYDTNASYSSLSGEYGTSTSYGNTFTGNTIGSNLSHNTKYYYRFKITDNWNRTSTWYTGDFTTTGNAPVINEAVINQLKSTSVSLTLSNVVYDTNAHFSKAITEYLLDGVSLVWTEESSTTDISSGNVLKPSKNYIAKISVYDNFNRQSASYSISFKTKGGFKYNGKMSAGAKLNGKEVIGMKFNGVEII